MNRGPMKDLKMEEASGQSQKIEAVVAVDSYLVKYWDQDGKAQVRMAFLVPGTEVGLIGRQSIQGNQIFVPMTKWFTEQLTDKVNELKGIDEVEQA